MRRLRAPASVLAVLLALFLAACGRDEEAASGPAELVPAGVGVYAEGTIGPEGEQKRALDALLAKFPGGGGAGEQLEALIEKGLRESDAPISYRKDVEPWLGDEAALFVSGIGADGQPKAAAGLVATDDEDAARAALEKSAEGKLTEKSHNDVEYLTDESGEAAAVLDGFVVLGTPAGVRAVIDAREGGKTLADDERYSEAVADAVEDRLGLIYVDSRKLFADGPAQAALPERYREALEEPIVATVAAEPDGVLFEATLSAALDESLAFLNGGSGLIEELPADAWLALGQDDIGGVLDLFVESFAGMAGGRDAVERQFEASTGLNLDEDVLAWMGDAGIFVRGTSTETLGGALVVETSDEDATRRFIERMRELGASSLGGGAELGDLSAPGGGEGFTFRSPDMPQPLHMLTRDGRFVVAYGDAAARDALAEEERLGDSDGFADARDSLGSEDVSLILLVQPVLELVEASGAGADPGWAKVRPYLEPLGALVAGGSRDGDELRSVSKLTVP